MPAKNPVLFRKQIPSIEGLDNLCRFWRWRDSLPGPRGRRAVEYLVEVMAESLGKEDWRDVLEETARRAADFYPGTD